MRNIRALSVALALLVLFLIPTTLAAEINVGNGPTSDLWHELMQKEFALDVSGTPALNVCRFFTNTTGFTFVCSRDLVREEVTIHMKAPFERVLQNFLDQLKADCYFGPTFAFVAKPNDPGLGVYPQPDYVPEVLRNPIIFDFRETMPQFAEFFVGVTGIPIEMAPELRPQILTMYVQDLPVIDAMECVARYLRAPMRLEVEDEGLYGTIYFGSPRQPSRPQK